MSESHKILTLGTDGGHKGLDSKAAEMLVKSISLTSNGADQGLEIKSLGSEISFSDKAIVNVVIDGSLLTNGSVPDSKLDSGVTSRNQQLVSVIGVDPPGVIPSAMSMDDGRTLWFAGMPGDIPAMVAAAQTALLSSSLYVNCSDGSVWKVTLTAPEYATSAVVAFMGVVPQFISGPDLDHLGQYLTVSRDDVDQVGSFAAFSMGSLPGRPGAYTPETLFPDKIVKTTEVGKLDITLLPEASTYTPTQVNTTSSTAGDSIPTSVDVATPPIMLLSELTHDLYSIGSRIKAALTAGHTLQFFDSGRTRWTITLKTGISADLAVPGSSQIQLASGPDDTHLGDYLTVTAGTPAIDQSGSFSAFASTTAAQWRVVNPHGIYYTDAAVGSADKVVKISSNDKIDPSLLYGSTWVIKNAEYGLVSGDKILADTFDRPIDLTLPLNPSVGDWVEITDGRGFFDSNSCTLLRNGQSIEGYDIDLVLNLKWQHVLLVFNGYPNGWVRVNAAPLTGTPGRTTVDAGAVNAHNLMLSGAIVPTNAEGQSGDSFYRRCTHPGATVTFSSQPYAQGLISGTNIVWYYSLSPDTSGVGVALQDALNAGATITYEGLSFTLKNGCRADFACQYGQWEDYGSAIWFDTTYLDTNFTGTITDWTLSWIIPAVKIHELYRATYAGWGSPTPLLTADGVGGGGTTWITKATDYTLVSKDRVLVDTSSGVVELTLPATPSVGDWVELVDVEDNFAIANCPLLRNGQIIEGIADDWNLDVAGIHLTLVFYGGTQGWVILVGTGGDTTSTILKKTVTLNAADIAAANTTPHEIVAAVSGKAISPIMLTYRFIAGSTTPLFCDACYIWETDDSSYNVFPVSWAYPTNGMNGNQTFAHDFTVAGPGIGASLKFQSGTVTDGDGTTSLEITVAYLLM